MYNTPASQTRLQALLHDFHSITHIDVTYVMFSSNELPKPITLREGANSFMTQLIKAPEMKERVAALREGALSRVTEYQELSCSYEPFPGLICHVFPVYARSVLLGCFCVGPIRIRQDRGNDSQLQRTELYRTCGLDAAAMTEMFYQIPILEKNALLAARRLLTTSVIYTHSFDFASLTATPLAIRIADYIDTQYMNDISPRSACDAFHISSSTLSRTLQKEFNKTFRTMLNQRRVRSVCENLQEGFSPEQASALSGFSSPAYMARVFSAIIGCSPHAYRQRIGNARMGPISPKQGK